MVNFERKETYSLQDLIEILRILRAPGGCPWDRAQTHLSDRRNFLEEAYEAAEAFDRDDPALMCEELGDMLFAAVNVVRKKGYDAEELLTRAADKFVDRFEKTENMVRCEGKDMRSLDIDTLDAYWQKAKNQ